MTDRPLPFTAPMIRALLDGRKLQTRRLIKPRNYSARTLFFEDWSDDYILDPGNAAWRDRAIFWRPGDRVWCREAWRTSARFDHLSPAAIGRDEGKKSAIMVWFEADDNSDALIPPGRLRAGMHMPRWASRLTLGVTGVRIERLQAITPEDAIREGYPFDAPPAKDRNTYIDWYAELWDAINPETPWGSNPWVIAIDFTVRKGNIDGVA